ncbi:MAG TPA: hypothetical protein VKT73_00050 [Xanthobacteraceae bacterium]|nr:hypothetical protein [Xanthobacteraceae bacterium]
MIATTAIFLDKLKEAAAKAESAETDFRREIAARLKAIEDERAFAYRRLNFMRALAEATATAESEEIAVARALAVVRAKLDWSSDNEARTAVLSRLAPVAQAMFVRLAPQEKNEALPDIGKALADFEKWYAETHAQPFWVLFEHYMPETPRVDF